MHIAYNNNNNNNNSLSVSWGGEGFGDGVVYLVGCSNLVLLRFLVRSLGWSPSVFNFLGLLEVVWKMVVEFVPFLLLSYVFSLSAPSVSPSGEL